MRKTRFTPDAQILRRREYESKLDTIKCHVHETQKLGARAEWELRVGDKQQLMDLARQKEHIRAQMAADLEQRRAKLAAKLAAEEAQLQRELLDLQASPESRRQALKQRALNLAAERKAAAAEESTHLRERQFADSCDPLRLRQSQLAAQQAVLDQQAQIQEARYRAEQQKAAEDAFANRLVAEDEAALMQQTLSRTAQRDAERSIAQTLDAQVARRRGAKQAEQAAEAAEEKAAKAAWALEEAHDQQRARDEKLRASQATVEAMRLNRLQLEASKAREAAAKQREHEELVAAIQAEEAAAAREASDKRARQQQELQYREELKASQHLAAKGTVAEDAAIEAQRRRIEEREDADRAAVTEARRQLERDVRASQQAFMQQHAQQRQTRKLQAAEEGARIEAEAAYEQSLKATARANTLREVQQQRASLEEMELNRTTRMQSQSDGKKAQVLNEARERAAFDAQVNAAVGAAMQRNQQGFGRRKMDWYT